MQNFRILLLYYSGTGATVYTAKQLGEQFQTMGHQVSYHRLTHTTPKNFEGYDLIGFGSPVWAWRAPRVVTNFLKGFTFGKMPYFTFASCGGAPGNVHASLFKVLRRQSPLYFGSFSVGGASNIRAWRPRIGDAPCEYNEIRQDDLAEVRPFCQNLIQRLDQWREEENSSLLAGRPKRKFFLSLLNTVSTYGWEMRMIVGNKQVDIHSCTQCGLCSSKICPSGAITMGEEGYPQFDEKLCQACQGCVNLCPELAISSKSSRNKQPLTTYREFITT